MKLFYHGSIVPERLPVAVIDALVSFPKAITLSFAGYETVGSVGYVHTLLHAAEARGLESRVRYLGVLPRGKLFEACAAADVGLAVMPKTTDDPNFRTMVGASNKPFDYLACGLALIVSDLPDWQRAFVAPGFALDCSPDDVASLIGVFGRLLNRPEAIRTLGERGRQRIVEAWNYEAQFVPVVQMLEAAKQ